MGTCRYRTLRIIRSVSSYYTYLFVALLPACQGKLQSAAIAGVLQQNTSGLQQETRSILTLLQFLIDICSSLFYPYIL
ncbi:MAG: hypothetical protein V7K67_11880 [Nostoc sp.]|uniref:hypothetical protein n=1 Tax=Nostoc sp. TaxID=1180 RepID=UPI002FFB32FF